MISRRRPRRGRTIWKLLRVTGPITLGLAVKRMKGMEMLVKETWPRDETFDVDPAIIPEVVVDDESAPAEEVLRPLFDGLERQRMATLAVLTNTGQRRESR
jgi:hypothetical protein